jgi:hypothetical protein
MPQSHAHQLRWSRLSHGVLQRHLRDAASSTARLPAALALEMAWRQRMFERPRRADSSPWRLPAASAADWCAFQPMAETCVHAPVPADHLAAAFTAETAARSASR